MKIAELEQTRGMLETLTILFKEGDKRPTELIELISPSADTFYVIVEKLKKYKLIKKQHDKSQDVLVWSLTPKGKEIAELLVEIERKLNL